MPKKKKQEDTLQSTPRRVIENEPGADQPGHERDPEPFVEKSAADQAVRSMPHVPQASPVPPSDGEAHGEER
jgi:hypothetical protein